MASCKLSATMLLTVVLSSVRLPLATEAIRDCNCKTALGLSEELALEAPMIQICFGFQ